MNTPNQDPQDQLLPTSAANSENIFDAFREGVSPKEWHTPGWKHPLHNLFLLKKICSFLSKWSIILVVIALIDVSIRTSEGSEFLKLFPPICSYYLFGIHWTEILDAQCQTLQEVQAATTQKIDQEKKLLVEGIQKYAPIKLQVENIAALPEVKFIQDRTGNNRKKITAMIDLMQWLTNTIKNQGYYLITCQDYSLEENGSFTVTCQSYGTDILSGSKESYTSRMGVAAFLDLINKESSLKVLEFPKTLDITESSSSEENPLTSRYSTATSVQLKLLYSPQK
jgi:hypothetical protein